MLCFVSEVHPICSVMVLQRPAVGDGPVVMCDGTVIDVLGGSSVVNTASQHHSSRIKAVTVYV